MTWNVRTAQRADLEVGPFTGKLTLSRPNLGIHDIGIDGRDVGIFQLMGFQLDVENTRNEPSARNSVEDAFVREQDLIVHYANFAESAATPRLLWSYEVDSNCLGIELRAYMQTPLLASHPQSTVRTRMSSRVEAIEGDGWLFRLPHVDYSLAFLVLGDECPSPSVHPKENELHWECQLFSSSLEKGVIQVGRVWSILVPRHKDVQRLRQFRDRIQQFPLPLTT